VAFQCDPGGIRCASFTDLRHVADVINTALTVPLLPHHARPKTLATTRTLAARIDAREASTATAASRGEAASASRATHRPLTTATTRAATTATTTTATVLAPPATGTRGGAMRSPPTLRRDIAAATRPTPNRPTALAGSNPTLSVPRPITALRGRVPGNAVSSPSLAPK